MLGTVGQLIVLSAFVACILSVVAYFLATQQGSRDWLRIGRATWIGSSVLVVAASLLLVYLIISHQFQYAYVFQYSSADLPLKYVFSSFWAGQEGSFMLWLIFNGIMGGLLIRWARDFEAPVMTVFAFCQFFLLTMIIGVKLGPIPIGSTPFSLLADKMPNAPVFQSNPNFIPENGQGLNDLLQNMWMMIHPPTLFVGFSAMLVPFCFAVAALWQKRYTDWVRAAIPWTNFGLLILMAGIVMGGYWAYVTLNFGGYWAWDPVENSSFVPWLVGVAALHMMIVQKRSGASHKAALFLCILAFMLVVYSTFLTRSGILGDISVHSFVDLGLNNQLLVWIIAMGVVGFGLFAYRYNDLPTPKQEPNMLSREFMIFSGALLLCALALVIILGTSSPIFGRLFRDSPSVVPISFYNKWSIPLTIGFTFLAGLGQLFWWKKMSVENVNRVLLRPIVLSVVSTVAVLIFTPFVQLTATPQSFADAGQAAGAVTQAGFFASMGSFWSSYGTGVSLLVLMFVAFFGLYGNGMVLLRIARGNLKMAGGAVTHIGFIMMILGFITSGSFSHTLSTEPGRPNFVLSQGETRIADGYRFTYSRKARNEYGHMVYTLDIEDPKGRRFQMKPVAYESKREQWIEHPDVQPFFEQDLFVAVSPAARFETEEDEKGGQLSMAPNDSTLLGNDEYALKFVNFNPDVDAALLPDSVEIAVAATMELTHLFTNETRTLNPVYIIMKDRSVQWLRNDIPDWDMSITFASMDVGTGEANFIIDGVALMPEDWVVVQAYEKPLINLVWFGSFFLVIGIGLAMFRRAKEHEISASRQAKRG
ncbi:MAG: cytochrome c biogenesis protein CcsA [Bacteroidota bacterium]